MPGSAPPLDPKEHKLSTTDPNSPPTPSVDDRATRNHDRATDDQRHRIDRAADATATGSIIFTGAIFGFFYAWVCSTMWGLDAADPRVAIEAMQAMNESVRNAVFFPAFFLTPIVLGAAGAMLHAAGRRPASRWFGAAAVVYLLGGLVLTMTVNVPMNEDLAGLLVPSSRRAAEAIWSHYSSRWQLFNTLRMVASGLALTLASIGLRHAGRNPD